MVEEAAGTKLYESKKASAEKTIGKKDSKLNEIEKVGNKRTCMSDLCLNSLFFSDFTRRNHSQFKEAQGGTKMYMYMYDY